MCGILGWCNFSEQPKIGILRNISKFLENRGPDAYGEFTNKYINLAHRRLSIIDLTRKSNQPILDSDTGNAIVFNGEIYNFQEIKREILFSVKNKSINVGFILIQWHKDYEPNLAQEEIMINHFEEVRGSIELQLSYQKN